MTTYFDVEPANLVQIISKIKINILYIEINKQATIQVLAFSTDNQLLTTYTFELVLPDYDEWHDDDWLIDYVCQKYGFVLKNNALTLDELLLFIGTQTNNGVAPVFDTWIIINSPSVFELLYECNDGVYSLISCTSYIIAL